MRKRLSFLRKVPDAADTLKERNKKQVEQGKEFTFKSNGDLLLVNRVHTELLP